MFQTHTFRAQECSRFALSRKRMFPTLTSRVQKCSRFSLSAWKKNVWTKFCVSGKNLDVPKV
jgi:hypothetical protein